MNAASSKMTTSAEHPLNPYENSNTQAQNHAFR